MNCHQVLSGACNSGDQCFAVGSVEGIPFTAYAAGCNIVILASNFERVQIIPGAIHGYVRIGCLDCSTDTGKIAAAYGSEVCVFEPTPLIHTSSTHGLEYRWVQTGRLVGTGEVSALSWNLEGTRLLTASHLLQLWHQASMQEETHSSSVVTFEIGGSDKETKPPEEDEPSWICVWKCHTATPANHLAFSPDGTLFATSGKNDRLVKIWYQNKILFPSKSVEAQSHQEVNYGYIYVAHPRAVTHLAWRKTSKYMPKGSVGNALVTSCVDNISRVWAETLLPEDEWGGGGAPAATRNVRSHRATHRHKHRFMQRLKHMKTCFHIRRNAQSSKQQLGPPIPTLPSTYSVHDFHNPYHMNSYSAGLHFHLAASVNAETDIPLVPALRSGQPSRFILHWLHNKEMHFTLQAESILHDLTRKILEKEEAEEAMMAENNAHDGENDGKQRKHVHKANSQEESNSDDHHTGSAKDSQPSMSNTTSANSLGADVTCTHLPDSLDAKIESLLRDWHHSPDLLFSVHPVDGSFLIWVVEWLDEQAAGALRQASVSFAARIPAAFPLGDATTMCTPAALYHTAGAPLYVRRRAARTHNAQQSGTSGIPEVSTPLASVQEEKEDAEWPQGQQSNGAENNTEHMDENGERTEATNQSNPKIVEHLVDEKDQNEGDLLSTAPCPVISMVTNHNNGTLNLWQLTFADKSKFSQVLSIGHASRASGHRFRVNDITCHPVLPLLLTTSHHNTAEPIPDLDMSSPNHHQDTTVAPEFGGLCSELVLWRVEAVGPLGKSGGVSELARVNSPHPSAFSNVAWLPTLLPCATLGNLSNSPSACFVASDGESLRVFQAVIDARTLLAEVASSERRHRMTESVLSVSSESTLNGSVAGLHTGAALHERVRIVSQQSTARPGAVLQLDAIADATHDWHNTQLLHVFQEQLITGERLTPKVESDIDDTGMVDLRRATTFEEPFYIVVLERTPNGSTVHMWRLVVASQPQPSEELSGSMMYVPDAQLTQEEEGAESRRNSVTVPDDDLGAARAHTPLPHLAITTTKVCSCELTLPPGVEVIHAAPAAGHLSSASIYPACLAPYIMATACSDSTLRFWKCDVRKKSNEEFDYTWQEWEMMNKEQESTIDITGQPLNISAAYSGRIAVAYKCGRSFTRTATRGVEPPGAARYVNLCVAVYECESTGGAEWLLEDTIPLRNVSLPRPVADAQIDLSYLHDTTFMQKKQRLTQVLQTLSHEDIRSTRNGDVGTENTLTPNSGGGKAAGLLAVPSFSTLQSLRKSITENGNTCPLTQKHLVQLDWVSKEDGSHILTVAIGSKILLFTPVSSDLAQANLKAMKESLNSNRPILRKASSLAAPHFVEEVRWMKLRALELRTADGLPPLPMQISWVRDGILVVGMDSEMHVYSQWKPDAGSSTAGHQQGYQESSETEGAERALREEDLRSRQLSRVSSINLQLLERDTKRRKPTQDQSHAMLDYLPDYGLFEASQMACPVLPQYHPKQLMELLNSGKIRWVKAILAHLVRCISATYTVRGSTGDEDSLSRQRGWSRSRTLSVSFAAGAASPLDNAAQITEDVQLDYAEITSVPPLPLWTLLVADKELPISAQEKKDYNELFEGTVENEQDLDKLLLEEEDEGDGENARKKDRRPSVPERLSLSHFGPRQGRLLSRLLTHTHLPGLSSLDQMHLLALADTVATCNTDFAERRIMDATRPMPTTDGMQSNISTDALDDCGLRFLLAMKHYGYLVRCLPLAARAGLQRTGISSCDLVWAFHSESHEQLLALIPSYAKAQPTWTTLRELGVGWWLRSPALLRTCVEMLARAAYQRDQDPMDAALYYLAMKKKALVWGLFRSRRDEKMTAFFSNNFGEERWRKAALKNAFALLGKQRFEHAAAFFLLGGALKDALEVLLTRLGDLQLAMVVARLYDSDSPFPESLQNLLYEEILGCDSNGENMELERAHPDPFLRSMALWQLRRYAGALDTLLAAGAGRMHHATARAGHSTPGADPGVFNFYVYLRTHPLLLRQNLGAQGTSLGIMQDVDEGVTRLERRLYFTTAHAHFKGGCPALALEVLSKLPARLRSDQKSVSKAKSALIAHAAYIDSGMLPTAKPDDSKAEGLDWGTPSIDWGAPVSEAQDDELVLKWDDDAGDRSNGSSSPPLEMKIGSNDAETEEHANAADEKEDELEEDSQVVDIMAQQLKFIACLKILMEELSTLATGFEVDGGHLRYQLYIWLEREAEALRQLCGYESGGDGELHNVLPPPDGTVLTCDNKTLPTLHQVLLQEKMEFEAKVQRAVKRKRWLKANETLLRTLLSYCVLGGAGGGGLAAVRMELLLLLQELGQERAPALLAPLPLPTTLPLLAAAVAPSRTVVADPVRHLQAQAHDMLASLAELGQPNRCTNFSLLLTLRDLAVALSAAIYQSLCDADTCYSPRCENDWTLGSQQSSAGQRSRCQSTDDQLVVTTSPNKWPGVSSMRALALRAAEEDDAPRLVVLLVEAMAAVYISLLAYALAIRDPHLLYRLVALEPGTQAWASLYGGGVRRLLTTAPTSNCTVTIDRTENASVWSSLRAQRARLNMRLLGTSAPSTNQSSTTSIREGRPTYREHFVPPQMSIVSYLLIKPSAERDPDNCDYDSADSQVSDAEDSESEAEDEDVFDTNTTARVSERLMRRENCEHSDPDSYSWTILRAATLRIAQQRLQDFLQLAGIEMQELATTSPLVHGSLRRLAMWQTQLTEQLATRAPPLHYLPAAFPDASTAGPPINKYRCLLEKHNTPFNANIYNSAPARRLWTFLVRQELVQDIFIRAVFVKKRPSSQTHNSDETKEASDTASDQVSQSGNAMNSHLHAASVHHDDPDSDLQQPVRIIHKEQDSISAFCLNQTTSSDGTTAALVAVATAREVAEMDIALLLRGAACWAEEAEVDLLALASDPAALPDTGFLLIQHTQQNKVGGGSSPGSSPQATPQPTGLSGQTGRGTTVKRHHSAAKGKRPTANERLVETVKGLQFPGCHDAQYCRLVVHRSKLLMRPVLKHKIDNVKRMSAHPTLPLYLTGGVDGSVQLWEWGHPQAVWSPRAPGAFAKVARVRFAPLGNKLGVADADGNLALWQVSPAQSRPFFTYQCHSKGISDFVFLGSCSLMATAGHSSESKNVAIWDSLMPQKKPLVVAWSCHEGGASCLVWAGSTGALVSGGRRGDVAVWDVRTRATRHRFQAHESPLKCMALTPAEDCYATGAADGDIKVWSLSSHSLLHWFVGEHARSSFFKHIGQGVTQIHIDGSNRLFSCGADGTMKVRRLPEREAHPHAQY